jgi:hypothetical protein
MPSPASIEVKANDLETMVTLSAVNNQVTTSVVVEDELTRLLMINKDANNIINETNTTTNTFVNGSSTYYSKEIDSDLRKNFELFTTQGLTDGTFAVSTQFDQSIPTKDSTTYNIGYNGVTQSKTISIVEPTNPIYDSHIEVTISDNNGEFKTQDNNFGVMFDGSISNNNFIRAINSEFSTTDGSKPMYVEEAVDFNNQYTSGKDTTHYFELNTTTGLPNPILFNSGNQSDTNGLIVSMKDISKFTLNNAGTYRVQQFPNTCEIDTYSNDNINAPVSVQNLPLYNSTISNIDYVTSRLPADSLFIDVFNTIFDMSYNVIVPGWKINVDIENTNNSGYSVTDTGNKNLEPTGIFSLDDTQLHDNFIYMKDFVNGNHKLEFNNASLRILTQENGEQQNITHAFSLSTGRETLEKTQIINGEIKLNINDINSRVVVNNKTGLENEKLNIEVHYNSESSLGGISTELKENSYVKYLNQLVVKNPMVDIGYAHNNNASLNLYNNNKTINDLYAQNTIQFESLTFVPESTFEVFKINSLQNLTSLNGFRDAVTNTEMEFVKTTITLSNLNNLSENNTILTSSRFICNLKKTADLSLTQSANIKGWNTISQTNDILTVSSRKSYADNTTVWPTLIETTNLLKNSNNLIYYKISILTSPPNVNPNFLTDKILIEWGSSPTNLTSSKQIYQEYFTRISKDNLQEVVETEINSSQYEIIDNLIPLPNKFKLVKSSVKRYFKYSFDSFLRQYDGLKLETPELYSENTYYTLIDTTNCEDQLSDEENRKLEVVLSESDLLNIRSTDTNNPINYAEFTEQFYTVNTSDKLFFEGTLTQLDFQDLSVKINAFDDNNQPIELTNTYPVSSQFGIPIVMELVTKFENIPIAGDIRFSLKSSFIQNRTGNEGEVTLNSHNGYIILLSPTYHTIYTVDYFSAPFEDLGNSLNTDISLDTSKFLTVANGYSNIKKWNSLSHKIKLSYENTNKSTTVLTLVTNDAAAEAVCVIKTPNFKFINTQMIISRGNKDCYRRIKHIGNNAVDNTRTEIFFPVNYFYTNDTNQTFYNRFSIDTGVYLSLNSGLNVNTIKTIGNITEFTLLSDNISVNMIGSASDNLTPIQWVSSSDNGLTRQYKTINNESRILTLQRYRGFYGIQTNNQIYKIERDIPEVIFSVTNSINNKYASQKFLPYYNSTFDVNYLVDSDGNLVGTGSIGLKLHFNYSMLNVIDSVTFPIGATGDNVTISIVNPKVVSFTPVILNKTLKDYVLYQYDGQNFNNTNGNLRYNSSRLKLNNGIVSSNKVTYIMKLISKLTKVYYIPNYLGNPIDNGDLNPYFDPLNWGSEIGSATYDDIITSGIDVNALNIKLQSGFNNQISISYFVQLPPYLKFGMRSNTVNEMIPYDPSVNNSQNTVTRYLPVTKNVNVEGNKEYYPFTTESYTYINNSTHTVTFNTNQVNNVKIVDYNKKATPDYITTPNVTRNSFKIEGNNYTIKLLAGLKDETGTVIETLFTGPANRLLELTSTNPNLWLDTTTLYNDRVFMNIRQSVSPYNISANSIFANDNQFIQPNIKMQIDSFFITNSNMNKFNLISGPGQKVTLYTRKVALDEASGIYKINVYKYIPLTSIGNDGVNLDAQVDTILYNSRYIKSVNVPTLVIGETTIPNWDNLLNNITLQDVKNTSWSLDSSFNTVVSLTLANLNKNVMTIVPPLIFSSTSSNQPKVTVVTKRPVMRFLNKLGMPLMEVDCNGNVKSQIVSTNSLALNNVYGNILDNSFKNYNLLSSISYGTGF